VTGNNPLRRQFKRNDSAKLRDRALARTAAAEILAGHEQLRVRERRTVEDERRAVVAARFASPPEEHACVVGMPADVERGDRIGIDVVFEQRGRNAAHGLERRHAGTASRGSAIAPRNAVAAAVSGLARCVRTPGP
jgi:hypothetical protein